MEARVAMMEAKPGELADVVAAFDTETVESARDLDGNRGFLILSDPETNRALAISLWETREEADASDAFFERVAPNFGRHLTHRPERETFDVHVASLHEARLHP
ncbi:MAG: antibiotic biosynthesis monooxygenase [Actinobacteria bacterium]|nr:antibiotic biosynthesis monooxygenase [Actinomycetota bacterium]